MSFWPHGQDLSLKHYNGMRIRTIFRTLLLSASAIVGTSALASVQVTKQSGWLETCYAEWAPGAYANYNAYVRPVGGDYVKLDAMLLRDYGSYMRVDALGLKAGDYQLKIVPVGDDGNEVAAEATETETLAVKAHDRDGFAHFKHSAGIGAYTNDGTLKPNAKVFYVTAKTAKTVSTEVAGVGACTGMQAIIDAYEKGKDSTPMAFRIIGTVQTADMDYLKSKAEGLELKGKEGVAMNITIEGVGNDATIKGFGIVCSRAENIEIRNLGIMTLIDDGISLQSGCKRIWMHNNDVFYGPNKGGDQAKGDGAMDVKDDSQYITYSYNHFWDTGKTSLCGMKSETGPNYITYHHNWFDHSDSRHPRVRRMTVHVYNNYYDGISKYGAGATTGADLFVEANYFRNCSKPMLISKQGTDINNGVGSSDDTKGTFSGETGGSIKSFNNVMKGSYKYQPWSPTNTEHFDAYEATSRDEKVPSTVVALYGGDTYSNFDTDPAVMPNITPDDPNKVPDIVCGPLGAGRCEKGDLQFTFNNSVDDKSADINPALAALVKDYKTTLVGIVGGEQIGTGTGGEQGGEETGGEQGGEEGGDVTVPEGSFECHFTGKKPSSAFYTISGNYSNSKGTYTAPNGTTYKDCLKMESSTSITFKIDNPMTILLGFAEATPDIKIDGEKTQGANNVVKVELAAGTHVLTKAGSYNLFYICLYAKEGGANTSVANVADARISYNGSAILNPAGKFCHVYTLGGAALAGSSLTEISTSNLPKGFYIVVAEGEVLRIVVR